MQYLKKSKINVIEFVTDTETPQIIISSISASDATSAVNNLAVPLSVAENLHVYSMMQA